MSRNPTGRTETSSARAEASAAPKKVLQAYIVRYLVDDKVPEKLADGTLNIRDASAENIVAACNPTQLRAFQKDKSNADPLPNGLMLFSFENIADNSKAPLINMYETVTQKTIAQLYENLGADIPLCLAYEGMKTAGFSPITLDNLLGCITDSSNVFESNEKETSQAQVKIAVGIKVFDRFLDSSRNEGTPDQLAEMKLWRKFRILVAWINRECGGDIENVTSEKLDAALKSAFLNSSKGYLAQKEHGGFSNDDPEIISFRKGLVISAGRRKARENLEAALGKLKTETVELKNPPTNTVEFSAVEKLYRQLVAAQKALDDANSEIKKANPVLGESVTTTLAGTKITDAETAITTSKNKINEMAQAIIDAALEDYQSKATALKNATPTEEQLKKLNTQDARILLEKLTSLRNTAVSASQYINMEPNRFSRIVDKETLQEMKKTTAERAATISNELNAISDPNITKYLADLEKKKGSTLSQLTEAQDLLRLVRANGKALDLEEPVLSSEESKLIALTSQELENKSLDGLEEISTGLTALTEKYTQENLQLTNKIEAEKRFISEISARIESITKQLKASAQTIKEELVLLNKVSPENAVIHEKEFNALEKRLTTLETTASQDKDLSLSTKKRKLESDESEANSIALEDEPLAKRIKASISSETKNAKESVELALAKIDNEVKNLEKLGFANLDALLEQNKLINTAVDQARAAAEKLKILAPTDPLLEKVTSEIARAHEAINTAIAAAVEDQKKQMFAEALRVREITDAEISETQNREMIARERKELDAFVAAEKQKLETIHEEEKSRPEKSAEETRERHIIEQLAAANKETAKRAEVIRELEAASAEAEDFQKAAKQALDNINELRSIIDLESHFRRRTETRENAERQKMEIALKEELKRKLMYLVSTEILKARHQGSTCFSNLQKTTGKYSLNKVLQEYKDKLDALESNIKIPGADLRAALTEATEITKALTKLNEDILVKQAKKRTQIQELSRKLDLQVNMSSTQGSLNEEIQEINRLKTLSEMEQIDKEQHEKIAAEEAIQKASEKAISEQQAIIARARETIQIAEAAITEATHKLNELRNSTNTSTDPRHLMETLNGLADLSEKIKETKKIIAVNQQKIANAKLILNDGTESSTLTVAKESIDLATEIIMVTAQTIIANQMKILAQLEKDLLSQRELENLTERRAEEALKSVISFDEKITPVARKVRAVAALFDKDNNPQFVLDAQVQLAQTRQKYKGNDGAKIDNQYGQLLEYRTKKVDPIVNAANAELTTAKEKLNALNVTKEDPQLIEYARLASILDEYAPEKLRDKTLAQLKEIPDIINALKNPIGVLSSLLDERISHAKAAILEIKKRIEEMKANATKALTEIKGALTSLQNGPEKATIEKQFSDLTGSLNRAITKSIDEKLTLTEQLLLLQKKADGIAKITAKIDILNETAAKAVQTLEKAQLDAAELIVTASDKLKSAINELYNLENPESLPQKIIDVNKAIAELHAAGEKLKLLSPAEQADKISTHVNEEIASAKKAVQDAIERSEKNLHEQEMEAALQEIKNGATAMIRDALVKFYGAIELLRTAGENTPLDYRSQAIRDQIILVDAAFQTLEGMIVAARGVLGDHTQMVDQAANEAAIAADEAVAAANQRIEDTEASIVSRDNEIAEEAAAKLAYAQQLVIFAQLEKTAQINNFIRTNAELTDPEKQTIPLLTETPENTVDACLQQVDDIHAINSETEAYTILKKREEAYEAAQVAKINEIKTKLEIKPPADLTANDIVVLSADNAATNALYKPFQRDQLFQTQLDAVNTVNVNAAAVAVMQKRVEQIQQVPRNSLFTQAQGGFPTSVELQAISKAEPGRTLNGGRARALLLTPEEITAKNDLRELQDIYRRLDSLQTNSENAREAFQTKVMFNRVTSTQKTKLDAVNAALSESAAPYNTPLLENNIPTGLADNFNAQAKMLFAAIAKSLTGEHNLQSQFTTLDGIIPNELTSAIVGAREIANLNAQIAAATAEAKRIIKIVTDVVPAAPAPIWYTNESDDGANDSLDSKVEAFRKLPAPPLAGANAGALREHLALLHAITEAKASPLRNAIAARSEATAAIARVQTHVDSVSNAFLAGHQNMAALDTLHAVQEALTQDHQNLIAEIRGVTKAVNNPTTLTTDIQKITNDQNASADANGKAARFAEEVKAAVGFVEQRQRIISDAGVNLLDQKLDALVPKANEPELVDPTLTAVNNALAAAEQAEAACQSNNLNPAAADVPKTAAALAVIKKAVDDAFSLITTAETAARKQLVDSIRATREETRALLALIKPEGVKLTVDNEKAHEDLRVKLLATPTHFNDKSLERLRALKADEITSLKDSAATLLGKVTRETKNDVEQKLRIAHSLINGPDGYAALLNEIAEIVGRDGAESPSVKRLQEKMRGLDWQLGAKEPPVGDHSLRRWLISFQGELDQDLAPSLARLREMIAPDQQVSSLINTAQTYVNHARLAITVHEVAVLERQVNYLNKLDVSLVSKATKDALVVQLKEAQTKLKLANEAADPKSKKTLDQITTAVSEAATARETCHDAVSTAQQEATLAVKNAITKNLTESNIAVRLEELQEKINTPIETPDNAPYLKAHINETYSAIKTAYTKANVEKDNPGAQLPGLLTCNAELQKQIKALDALERAVNKALFEATREKTAEDNLRAIFAQRFDALNVAYDALNAKLEKIYVSRDTYNHANVPIVALDIARKIPAIRNEIDAIDTVNGDLKTLPMALTDLDKKIGETDKVLNSKLAITDAADNLIQHITRTQRAITYFIEKQTARLQEPLPAAVILAIQNLNEQRLLLNIKVHKIHDIAFAGINAIPDAKKTLDQIKAETLVEIRKIQFEFEKPNLEIEALFIALENAVNDAEPGVRATKLAELMDNAEPPTENNLLATIEETKKLLHSLLNPIEGGISLSTPQLSQIADLQETLSTLENDAKTPKADISEIRETTQKITLSAYLLAEAKLNKYTSIAQDYFESDAYHVLEDCFSLDFKIAVYQHIDNIRRRLIEAHEAAIAGNTLKAATLSTEISLQTDNDSMHANKKILETWAVPKQWIDELRATTKVEQNPLQQLQDMLGIGKKSYQGQLDSYQKQLSALKEKMDAFPIPPTTLEQFAQFSEIKKQIALIADNIALAKLTHFESIVNSWPKPGYLPSGPDKKRVLDCLNESKEKLLAVKDSADGHKINALLDFDSELTQLRDYVNQQIPLPKNAVSPAKPTLNDAAIAQMGVTARLEATGHIPKNYMMLESDLSAFLQPYIALQTGHGATLQADRLRSDEHTVFACAGVVCLPNAGSSEAINAAFMGFQENLRDWKKEIDQQNETDGAFANKAFELQFALQDSARAHFTLLKITVDPTKNKISITNIDSLAAGETDFKNILLAVRKAFPDYKIEKPTHKNTAQQKDGHCCGFHVAAEMVRTFYGEVPTSQETAILTADKDIDKIRHAVIQSIVENENKTISTDAILMADTALSAPQVNEGDIFHPQLRQAYLASLQKQAEDVEEQPKDSVRSRGRNYLDLMEEEERKRMLVQLATRWERPSYSSDLTTSWKNDDYDISINSAKNDKGEKLFYYNEKTQTTTFEYDITFKEKTADTGSDDGLSDDEQDSKASSLKITGTARKDNDGNDVTDWRFSCNDARVTWAMKQDMLAKQTADLRQAQIPKLQAEVVALLDKKNNLMGGFTASDQKELDRLQRDLSDYKNRTVGLEILDPGAKQDKKLIDAQGKEVLLTTKQYESIQAHMKHYRVVTFEGHAFQPGFKNDLGIRQKDVNKVSGIFPPRSTPTDVVPENTPHGHKKR